MSIKTVLILSILVVSLIGFIILLSFWKTKKREYYLIHSLLYLAFSVIFSSNALIYLFGEESNNLIVGLMSYLSFPALLSIAPLLFVYIKFYDSKDGAMALLKNNALHFIPSLSLLVINLFTYIAMSQIPETSDNSLFLTTVVKYINFASMFLVFLVQNVLYLYMSFSMIKKYKAEYNDSDNDTQNKETINWIWIFLLGYTALFALIYIFQLSYFSDYKSIMRLFVLVYLVLNIFLGSKLYAKLQKSQAISYLQDEQKKILNDKIIKAMEVDKIFLDSDLSLKTFAKHVDSNSKYLSKHINHEFKKNVSNFINEYRIKEAILLMEDPENAIYTMEYIAELTGYNSKSSFYNAFKSVTNMTPTEYKIKNNVGIN